jgi:hypothetical protein
MTSPAFDRKRRALDRKSLQTHMTSPAFDRKPRAFDRKALETHMRLLAFHMKPRTFDRKREQAAVRRHCLSPMSRNREGLKAGPLGLSLASQFGLGGGRGILR